MVCRNPYRRNQMVYRPTLQQLPYSIMARWQTQKMSRVGSLLSLVELIPDQFSLLTRHYLRELIPSQLIDGYSCSNLGKLEGCVVSTLAIVTYNRLGEMLKLRNRMKLTCRIALTSILWLGETAAQWVAHSGQDHSTRVQFQVCASLSALFLVGFESYC